MSRLIKIRDVGLVNIVAGRRIVPELIQHQATAESIYQEVSRLLHEPEASEKMRADLNEVKAKMGETGAAARVATLISSLANKPAQH